MKEIIYRLSWLGMDACLWLLIATPVSLAAWEPGAAFGLKSAGQFAVLSLGKPSAETDGQSKLDLSSAIVHGDVGVGPHGTLDPGADTAVRQNQ